MEHVVCMFYWGGEIIQDPNEGITYNPNEATGLYDIPRQSTLSELVDMLVPIMAENRESVRLKLICRYPYSTPMGMKYKRLLINDNRTLKNVLDIPARYSSLDCVEVYVVKDIPLLDAPLRTLQQPGTVTHLLTQGSDTTALRPQESHGTGLNTDSGHHTPVHTSLPSFGQCMPETTNIEHTGGDSRSPMGQSGRTCVMDRGTLNPGPIDGTLLYMQHLHRSRDLWEKSDTSTLTCRKAERGLWARPLSPRLLPYLLRAGFYGLHRVGLIRLDHALITALVERWRVETHTFHLPVGETTVTLQDVSVIWGVPIDGPPITGTDESRTVEEWQTLCVELLGRAPDPSDFSSGKLRISWIVEHFSTLPDDADDATVLHHARARILHLIGGMLLPDKTQNRVPLMYLPLLSDFDQIGTLSWGSACLASLYRNLCRASKSGTKDIAGPLLLLQIWAWERLPRMAPRRDIDPARPTRGQDTIQVGEVELPIGPHGCRWGVHFILENTPMHVVTVYRDQLDQLRDVDYIWQPYSEELIASLPEYCRNGMDIWRTRSPLVCFEVVEWHFPDRVLRQFGLRQPIPDLCDTEPKLHHIDRRGHSGKNWGHEHRSHIQMWEERHGRIVDGDVRDERMRYDDPYMVWYRSITRLLIGNPAHRVEDGYQGAGGVVELLTQCVSTIYKRSDSTLLSQHGAGELSAAVDSMRQTCYLTLLTIRERDRLASTRRADAGDPQPTTTGPSPSVEPSSAMPLLAFDGPSPSVGPSSSVPPHTPISPSPSVRPSADKDILDADHETASHSGGGEDLTPLPAVTPSSPLPSTPFVSSPLPSVGSSVAATPSAITQYNSTQKPVIKKISMLLKQPVRGKGRGGIRGRGRARGRAEDRGRGRVHHPEAIPPPATTCEHPVGEGVSQITQAVSPHATSSADSPVEAAADTTQASTADTTQAATADTTQVATADTTQAAAADTTQAVTADTTQAATDSSGQRGHAEHRRSHSPESVDLIYRRTKRVTRRPAYGT